MNLLGWNIDFTDPVIIGITAVAAALILLIIIIVAVACSRSKKKKAKAATVATETATVTQEEKYEETKAVSDPEPVEEVNEPQTVTETKSQTASSETPARKTIKVTVKPKTEQPVKKQTVKITEKPKAEQPSPEEKKDDGSRVYHVSKRKDDGKWQVKAEGAEKALKLFDTQAEAIDFAKGLLANNPDAQVRIHKVDGSYRKLSY